jgi:hypothetical protein
MEENKGLVIPKKGDNNRGEEMFNHQVRLNGKKTERFARVREILGGYSGQELLEILVDEAIRLYDDGNKVEDRDMLPKGLR